MAWILATGSVLAWAVGVIAAASRLLRWYMLRRVCRECQHHNCGWNQCHCDCDLYRPKLARGEIRERTRADGWRALVTGCFWPFIVVYLAARGASRAADRVLAGGVIRTKLTEPELRRRIGEQQREIDRLTAEIGEQP